MAWFVILISLSNVLSPLLQVSLDLVKSLYAKFIDWDDQMVDLETRIRSHATKLENAKCT